MIDNKLLPIQELGNDTYISDQELTFKPWSSNQGYQAKKLSIIAPDTAQSLFLYNVNNKESLNLKLIPNSVSEDYASRIIKESGIYGRMRPINFYTGGGGKTLSFSFDLHEDLNNVGGSLYELLRIMKRMSRPTFGGAKKLIKEPIVYFQLGEQFAGKGHISTEYTLNKPYRKDLSINNRGRYAFANISITFTFHEEFNLPAQVLTDSGNQAFTSAGINLSEAYNRFLNSGMTEQGLSIEDFIEEVTANQYYIMQTFASEKLLGGFLNAVNIKPGSALSRVLQDLAERGQNLGNLESSWSTYSETYGYGQDQGLVPVYAAIFNFYVDLSNILSSDLVVVNKKNAMAKFFDIVLDYYKDFREKLSKAYINYNPQSGTVAINYGTTSNPNLVKMKVSDANRAVTELMNILEIISYQKAIYTSLMGAGE